MNINVPKESKVDVKKTSIFYKIDVGYKKGYDDGYSGSTDISAGKDTVNKDYWLGYSCECRDGTFDRENGNARTC